MSDHSLSETRRGAREENGSGWWVAVLIAAAALFAVAMLVRTYSA
jgi:hypothetical protein